MMRTTTAVEAADQRQELVMTRSDWDLFVVHLPEDSRGLLRGLGVRLQGELTASAPVRGAVAQGRQEARLALASGLHAAYDASDSVPVLSLRSWQGQDLPLDVTWGTLARTYLPRNPAVFFEALSQHLTAGIMTIHGTDPFSRAIADEFRRFGHVLHAASVYCQWALDDRP